MKKIIKTIFYLFLSFILGVLFLGSVDLYDIRFKSNIRRLKKEVWFKNLNDSAVYYEKIYQNQKLKDYLSQDNIVKKILEDEQEKEYLISLIK